MKRSTKVFIVSGVITLGMIGFISQAIGSVPDHRIPIQVTYECIHGHLVYSSDHGLAVINDDQCLPTAMPTVSPTSKPTPSTDPTTPVIIPTL